MEGYSILLEPLCTLKRTILTPEDSCLLAGCWVHVFKLRHHFHPTCDMNLLGLTQGWNSHQGIPWKPLHPTLPHTQELLGATSKV